MINAELNHNPYLLETTVRFNGNEPRINSQIEKYDKRPLKDWVRRIPAIFYDEMNGYDFDLYFAGTKADYDEVCASFAAAGVSSEDVRTIYKNELEDADTKSSEIDALLAWLKEHPNAKFDFEKLWENHSELFEGKYPYILLHGTTAKSFDPAVNIEMISSAAELSSTDLNDTPILFYIDSRYALQFRKDLVSILGRSDIRQEQLFFMIHPSVNAEQMTRVISDLGVIKPQIVHDIADDQIRSYIRNYPVTAYIREAIRVFAEQGDVTRQILETEKQESMVTNAGINAEIEDLEEELRRLRSLTEYFGEHDNYILPRDFEDQKLQLMEWIQKWRNKKTKITGDEEIENSVNEFTGVLEKGAAVFAESINILAQRQMTKIEDVFHERYARERIDTEFKAVSIPIEIIGKIQLPMMSGELMKLVTYSQNEGKNDFFGILKKQVVADSASVSTVAVCNLERWRLKAQELIIPLADEFIHHYNTELEHFYNQLAEVYLGHVQELIEEKSRDKEVVSAQLSGEERLLQDNLDWFVEFESKLNQIMRG